MTLLSARRGFTLLEVMMVSAIMTVILLAVGMVISSTSTELAVSVPESDLQTNSQRTLMRVVEELTAASAGSVSIATDTKDGRWISFMVPVDLDASWGIHGGTPDYTPRYGAKLGQKEARGPARNAIYFVESKNPRVSPVNEKDIVRGGLNINVNTEVNKDTADSFAMGHLVFVYDPDGLFPVMNGDETVRPMTGDWVAQVKVGNNYGGDVDGDGSDADTNGTPDDYIFYRPPGTNSVVINLWGLRVIRRQRTPLLVNDRTTVTLINP